ncbi:thiol oxidoreductase, partial [Rhizobium leguminosarum]
MAFCATLAGFSVSIAAGLDLPRKRTDLSEADLKRVADVTRTTADFSKAEQYEAMQAGATTSIEPVT